MKYNKQKLILALDIGSSKICALVGEVNWTNKDFRLLTRMVLDVLKKSSGLVI